VPLWLEGGRRLRVPSLTAAFLAGVLTLFAPFLILQTALGFGIAASRTPRPWLARGLNLLTHLVCGVRLYVVAPGVSGKGGQGILYPENPEARPHFKKSEPHYSCEQ